MSDPKTPKSRKQSSKWLKKMSNVSAEGLIDRLFSGKQKVGGARTIYLNENLPPEALEKGKPKKDAVYCTNQVLTSKYTIFTFIPRNLMEQFRRVANVFFLAIDILQFFPKFATISPGLVILPLIVVLAITAIKDGYEDIKRHQSDRRGNQTQTHVLQGGGYVNPNVTDSKSRSFTPKNPFAAKSKHVDEEKIEEKARQSIGDGHAHPPPTSKPTGGPTAPRPQTEGSPLSTADADPDADPGSGQPYFAATMWEDVTVGSFIKLYNNDSIPSDIVICATSEPENVAFVETKNLDGETNLKSRRAVPELAHLTTAAECALAQFRIEAEAPHVNMYSVHAAVVIHGEEGQAKHAVDAQTVLLRGTVLRNTGWVIGVVLYTGNDTKIMLNSGATPSKRSKVERQMNPQVLVNLALLAVIAVVCAIADSIIERRKQPTGAYWLIDDNTPGDNPTINGLVTFANALITFQNVIPISLYISIEFVRTCQAAFIYFDKDIWYEKTDSATLARSWNLSDDLGQIEYVMSDKTGTLTQNKMVFRQCSVGGKVYKGEDSPEGAAKSTSYDSSSQDSERLAKAETKLPTEVLARFYDAELAADLRQPSDSAHSRSLNGFFNTLALCHTVLAATDEEGRITYKAQSPDEAALVQAAADVGFVFKGRDREVLRLLNPAGEVEEYELLNVLEFTSARKRMSVVVRRMDGGDGRLFLLSKGADNVIFERLAEGSGSDEMKDKTDDQLQYFASEGLRTLCLAYRVVPEDEYEAWSREYQEAEVAIDDRDDKIEAVSGKLEHSLRLLGATAIEDKLQDGVPAAIADLKRAGIKVWVATGDKLETAISIGYSTNLLAKDANLIIVKGGGAYGPYDQLRAAAETFFEEEGILEAHPECRAPEEGRPAAPHRRGSRDLRRMNTGVSSLVGPDNGNRPGGYSLVIDGAALQHALAEPYSKELLLQVSTRCDAVVCCRVSPKQKAEIVRLVKDGLGAMCLAIGDGANDVSMIQAADVGVGITGEEGLQAVNSSDYAIAQFRFLTRLLFVHGHWSYVRNSNMILNFFYKNIVAIGVLFWFQIYCAWSTTYVFEYTYLLFWNVFWSLCPVIAIGIFDRNIDDDILVALPELYRYGRQGRWFGTGRFSVYMLEAAYQSIVLYFFVLYAYQPSISARKDGWDIDMYEFSTTMVIATVMAVNFYNGMNTYTWTGWVFFAVIIGPLLCWLYTIVYNVLPPHLLSTFTYGNDHFLFESAFYWLCIPLAFILALLPRYLWKVLTEMYFPDDIDILRQVRKHHPEVDIHHDPRLGGRLTEITKRAEQPNGHPPPDDAAVPAEDEAQASDFPRPSVETVASPVSPRSPGMMSQFSHQYPPTSDRIYRRQTNGSRTDMSTGLRSTGSNRGFDFSTEEGGVAMQRIQSHLSEASNRRRHGFAARLHLPGSRSSREGGGRERSGSVGMFPSLRRSVRRKKDAARPTVMAPVPPHGPS